MTRRELGKYEDKGLFLERFFQKQNLCNVKGSQEVCPFSLSMPCSAIDLIHACDCGFWKVRSGSSSQISEKKYQESHIYLEPSSMREFVLAHLGRKLK